VSLRVSIAKAKRDFSQLLQHARKEPVIVTRRGKPDAVILPYEEYERLGLQQAYSSMLRLSEELKESGVTASELYEASREELEGRPWS
jgi:prevent-host-death family protein